MKSNRSHMLSITFLSIVSLSVSTVSAASSKNGMGGKKEEKLSISGTGQLTRGKDSYFLTHKLRSISLIHLDYKLTPAIKYGFFYANTYYKTHTRIPQYIGRVKERAEGNTIFFNSSYHMNPDLFLIVTVGCSRTPTRFTRVDNQTRAFAASQTKANLYSVSPAVNYSQKFGAWTTAFQVGYGHNDAFRKTANANRRSSAKSSSHNDSTFIVSDISYSFKNVSSNIVGLSPFLQAWTNHSFETLPFTSLTKGTVYRSRDYWSASAGFRVHFTNDMSMNMGWHLLSSKKKALSNSVGFALRAGV